MTVPGQESGSVRRLLVTVVPVNRLKVLMGNTIKRPQQPGE